MNNNYISQLTLERYNMGKLSDKESKIVEAAISSDKETLDRYEAIRKSDEELSRTYPLEKLPKLAAIKDAVIPVFENGISSQNRSLRDGPQGKPRLRYKPLIMGICAAVIVVAVFLSALIFVKGRNNVDVQEEAVAQSSEEEITDDVKNDNYEESIEVPGSVAAPAIPYEPQRQQKQVQKPKQEVKQEAKQKQETKPEPKITQSSAEAKNNFDGETRGTEIAAAPQPDTGVRTRGGNSGQQNEVTTPSEQESNLNIPPGISFIFDNMFANKQLSYAVIPGRITSIGKNAFAGNPLLSVTIGANVNIDDGAFPGNFKDVYTSHGSAAGTYIRKDINDTWTKR